ncbi:hypothetical protein OS493_004454 [Desmophyllum pertusum]|uniref:Uncharacterized protein n=1 Tax=Desmophyllum pertusum TaxID=174260 RepID=A0A9W9ZG41_9CNID|nr:hypothetical protein OS493_004454 [Desmophyllum pertusum]
MKGVLEYWSSYTQTPSTILAQFQTWKWLGTHMSRQNASKAKKGALEMYDQVMTELMSSTELPCEGNEILKNHEMAQRKSMEIFEEETAHLISTSIRWELNELMNVKYWKDTNASRTRHSCKDLLRELKTRHLDPVLKSISGSCETRASYADITNGLKTIKKEFHKKAVGAKDIKAEVFFEFNQYLQEEVMKYQEILGKMKDDDEALARQKMIAAIKKRRQRDCRKILLN